MLLSSLLICSLVFAAVTVHYAMLWLLKTQLEKLHHLLHVRIMSGIFGTLAAHIIEIGLFAIGYYWMGNIKGVGFLEGSFNGSFVDYVYFSATTYTTLGFGDIEPYGLMRLLVGVESLLGLVLITWTASFLYIQLQDGWREKGKKAKS